MELGILFLYLIIVAIVLALWKVQIESATVWVTRSQELWWHPRWFLGLPRFYWLTIPLEMLAILWGFGIIR